MLRWLRRKLRESRRRKRLGIRVLRFDRLEDRRLLNADWHEFDGDDVESRDDGYGDGSESIERLISQQQAVVFAARDSDSGDSSSDKSHDALPESENKVDDSQTISVANASGWSDDTAAAFESVASEMDTGDASISTVTSNDLLRALYSNSTASRGQSQNLLAALESQNLLDIDDIADTGGTSLPTSNISNLGGQTNNSLVDRSDADDFSPPALAANSTPANSGAASINTSGSSNTVGDDSGQLVQAASESSKTASAAETTDKPAADAGTDAGESKSLDAASEAANRSEVDAAKLTDSENGQPAVEGREADAAVGASALAGTRAQAEPQELKSQEASRADAAQAGPESEPAGRLPAAVADSSSRAAIPQTQTEGIQGPSGGKAERSTSASPASSDAASSWQLCTALPADFGAMETTLKNLFATSRDHRGDLLGRIRQLDAFDWTLVVAIALLSADVARRKKQSPLASNAFPFEGRDEWLWLFPEFLGVRSVL